MVCNQLWTTRVERKRGGDADSPDDGDGDKLATKGLGDAPVDGLGDGEGLIEGDALSDGEALDDGL